MVWPKAESGKRKAGRVWRKRGKRKGCTLECMAHECIINKGIDSKILTENKKLSFILLSFSSNDIWGPSYKRRKRGHILPLDFLLLPFFVSLSALFCLFQLLHLAFWSFKERFNKLVPQLFEGRIEWPKNSTPTSGNITISGSCSLNDPLYSHSLGASTLSYLSFRHRCLING